MVTVYVAVRDVEFNFWGRGGSVGGEFELDAANLFTEFDAFLVETLLEFLLKLKLAMRK